MESKLSSTSEIRERLTKMLTDVNSQLVSRWLKDSKERPEDIGETVGLMLQVVAGLMGEIDVFIGSVDTATSPTPSGPEETELVDLVTDEPISSLLRIEAPFHLAEGSV